MTDYLAEMFGVDHLAKEAEDFFMDKLKATLSENEKNQIKKKFIVPNNLDPVSYTLSPANAKIPEHLGLGKDYAATVNQKNIELATLIKNQFFDEFGDSAKARALSAKIFAALTSQLNSEILYWRGRESFFRRLAHPTSSLDTWNKYVGQLIKYSKSILSTFVQEWYGAVLVPRLKARADKAKLLIIGAVGLVIMFFFFLSQK